MFWEQNRPTSTVDQDSETETITSFQAENFHRETLEDELTKLQLKNLKLESKYKAAKFELKNCRTQINEFESKQCIRCKDLEAQLKESKALIGQYEIRNEQVEKDLQLSRSQNSKLQNENDQLISLSQTLTNYDDEIDILSESEASDISSDIIRERIATLSLSSFAVRDMN